MPEFLQPHLDPLCPGCCNFIPLALSITEAVSFSSSVSSVWVLNLVPSPVRLAQALVFTPRLGHSDPRCGKLGLSKLQN